MIDQDKSNIAVVIAKCFNNTGITLIEEKTMIIDKINKLKAVSQTVNIRFKPIVVPFNNFWNYVW